MQLKRCLTIFFMQLFTLSSHAATWSLEIKDMATSEVKTYKFTEAKAHRLEMPKLKKFGCMFTISKPKSASAGTLTTEIQTGDVSCSSPQGGFFTIRTCLNVPDEIEKINVTEFQVFEDSDKVVAGNKKSKTRSYEVFIRCE